MTAMQSLKQQHTGCRWAGGQPACKMCKPQADIFYLSLRNEPVAFAVNQVLTLGHQLAGLLVDYANIV